MFGLLLLAYMVNAMDRQVFPVLLPAVRENFGFGGAEAGLQSTIFALGMGIAGIPTGYLVDRFPRKTVTVVGTLVFSIATALTTLSAGFWDMTIWRVASGIGEAMQLTTLLAIASTAFAAHRGMAIGTVNVAFGLGALVGPPLGGNLLATTGSWHVPMITFAVIGVVVAILIMLFVKPWLTEQKANATAVKAILGGANTLVNRNTLILIVMTAIGGLVDFAYIGMYATFLQDHHNYTAPMAGIAVGLSGIGALASFFGGYLGDRFDPRYVMAIAFGLTGIAGAALFLGPSSLLWQSAFSLLFGLSFSGGAFVILASYLVKSVNTDLSGRASGLFVTSIYIPAAFAGGIMGWLADTWSWTTAGMTQIVVGSLVGLLLALFLKPSTFSRTEVKIKTAL